MKILSPHFLEHACWDHHVHLAHHPEYLQSPAAIFAAARLDRVDVVAFLLDLGMSVDIENEQKEPPLHQAAGNNALRAARLLIDRGAEVDARELRWGNTPLGHATYRQDRAMIDLLSAHSRDVWNLTFNGCVDRLREVLQADPALASEVRGDGITLLWWLPEDEDRAAQIVDLLLSHRADPAIGTKEGGTPAEYARRRGLEQAASRLAVDGTERPLVPEVERYKRLAKDILVAHESGDPGAMQRVQAHFGGSFTWEGLRSDTPPRLIGPILEPPPHTSPDQQCRVHAQL